jgi:hypothetical protein
MTRLRTFTCTRLYAPRFRFRLLLQPKLKQQEEIEIHPMSFLFSRAGASSEQLVPGSPIKLVEELAAALNVEGDGSSEWDKTRQDFLDYLSDEGDQLLLPFETPKTARGFFNMNHFCDLANDIAKSVRHNCEHQLFLYLAFLDACAFHFRFSK